MSTLLTYVYQGDAALEEHELYLCRECDREINLKEKELANFCNKNNLGIVHDLIYDADCGPSLWADGLCGGVQVRMQIRGRE